MPQSRPRVYGLFLKMKSDRLSEECREERQRDVKAAMQLIRRMQPQAPPECLRSVLSRTPPIIHGSSESAASPMNPSWENTEWPEGGPKWPQAHAKYVRKKGLQPLPRRTTQTSLQRLAS